jgi:outer membrane protein TolC
VQFSYPLGRATAEANLARARLQTSQTQKQLDALRIRVATEVRETGRQVTSNAKRVDATRASRALAEKRLESEEKKYQAGMSTNFLVFQAQRDLNQARNNELQALIDYLKSTVDYETVQTAPLTGAGSGVSSVAAVSAGASSALQLGSQGTGTSGRQQ